MTPQSQCGSSKFVSFNTSLVVNLDTFAQFGPITQSERTKIVLKKKDNQEVTDPQFNMWMQSKTKSNFPEISIAYTF